MNDLVFLCIMKAVNKKQAENMTDQIQCPLCYSYIELEDGSGYCILCEEVIYKSDEEITSDLLEQLDMPF